MHNSRTHLQCYSTNSNAFPPKFVMRDLLITFVLHIPIPTCNYLTFRENVHIQMRQIISPTKYLFSLLRFCDRQVQERIHSCQIKYIYSVDNGWHEISKLIEVQFVTNYNYRAPILLYSRNLINRQARAQHLWILIK